MWREDFFMKTPQGLISATPTTRHTHTRYPKNVIRGRKRGGKGGPRMKERLKLESVR
jgi:hypothetical protein